MFGMISATKLRSRLIHFFMVLFCAISLVGQVTADGVGYLYVKNYSEGDIIVYIDGYEQKMLYKGYYDWFPTTQGPHKLETKKVDNPYKYSSHHVACQPKGQVWVSERDFW